MSLDTDLMRRLNAGRVILDGGFGTMLIAGGLELGQAPERWNLTHPEAVYNVHGSYLASGADVITTNTFGASPSRLASHGLGDETQRINREGVRLAREAVKRFQRDRESGGRSVSQSGQREEKKNFVALSIGPTGKMLPPVGSATDEAIRDDVAGQIEGLDAGFDLVLIETIFDIREGLIALETVRRALSLPVAVSMTFARNPRGFFTVMGDEVTATIRLLEDAGADVIGANCSITSRDMLALAEIMRRSTQTPILCQPNAGTPRVQHGAPVYEQRPEDFAGDAIRLFEIGVNAVGGCCGTTPDFIRQVRTRL